MKPKYMLHELEGFFFKRKCNNVHFNFCLIIMSLNYYLMDANIIIIIITLVFIE